MNGDGNLDVVVVSIGSQSVWLGDGGLGFEQGGSIGDKDYRAVELADLDADGDLDALATIVQNQSWHNEVWMNDGLGEFQFRETLIADVSNPMPSQFGDFDGDGDVDILLNHELWLNNGDSFSQLWQIQNSPRTTLAGDFNGDGIPDMVVQSFDIAETGIWLSQNGQYRFEAFPLVGLGFGGIESLGAQGSILNQTVFTSGDLDGDGDLDLLATYPGGCIDCFIPGETQSMASQYRIRFRRTSLKRLPGNVLRLIHMEAVWASGNGAFVQDKVEFGTGTVQSADLDADGDQDIMVGSEIWWNERRGQLPGGTGDFRSSGLTIPVDSDFSITPKLGDVDGDRDIDVLAPDGRVWLNDGDGEFADQGDRVFRGEILGRYSSAAFGDVDADGDLDVLVFASLFEGGIRGFGFNPSYVGLWVNRGDGSFDVEHIQGLPFSSLGIPTVALRDLDGDGDLDAVTSVARSQRVLLNDGRGDFQSGTIVTPSTRLVDVDQDGDLDAFTGLATYRNDAGDYVETGDAKFAFRKADIADIDGDGDLDIVGPTIYTNEAGEFISLPIFAYTPPVTGGPLADLDGDGDVERLDHRTGIEVAAPIGGDIDFDGDVDFADFLAFSAKFGQSAQNTRDLAPDIDGSGTVDFTDFLILSKNFGREL